MLQGSNKAAGRHEQLRIKSARMSLMSIVVRQIAPRAVPVRRREIHWLQDIRPRSGSPAGIAAERVPKQIDSLFQAVQRFADV